MKSSGFLIYNLLILNKPQLKMKLLCSIICIIGIYGTAIAQTSVHYDPKDYAQIPVWIKMMDDPNVNFFEIGKAYKSYWQHHTKPTDDEELKKEQDVQEKIPTIKQQQEIAQENHMKMAIRKYEYWHEQMRPYVQKDGHILSAKERLKSWQEQKQISGK